MATPASKKRKTTDEDDATFDTSCFLMPPSPGDEAVLSNSCCHDYAEKYTVNDMVKLLVGECEHELHTHASTITRDSDYFNAALKKSWIEGRTRTVRLPEEDPRTVQHYLDFICGQGLPSRAVKTSEQLEQAGCYPWISRLYVFGEYVGNTSICNAILDEFLRLGMLADGN